MAALCCAQPGSPTRHRLQHPCSFPHPGRCSARGHSPPRALSFAFPLLVAKCVPETGCSPSQELYKLLQIGLGLGNPKPELAGKHGPFRTTEDAEGGGGWEAGAASGCTHCGSPWGWHGPAGRNPACRGGSARPARSPCRRSAPRAGRRWSPALCRQGRTRRLET